MKSLFTLVIGCILFLSSCKKFSNEWQKDGYTGNRFTKLVIVGIDPDLDSRIFFENTGISWLKERGFNALTGIKIFPQRLAEAASSEDTITQIIQSNKVDAILTFEIKIEKDDTYVIPESYNRFSKFYSRKPFKPYTPSYHQGGHRFLLVASLFDLKDHPDESSETLVWNASKIILNPETNEGMKNAFVQDVIDHLLDQGVIRFD